MASTEESIAALDHALADEVAGEDVILRRISGTGNAAQNIDVPVRAAVRNFRLREEDLAGGVMQGMLIVSISPTQIHNAQWPGGVAPGQSVDASLPRINDKLIIKGRVHNVDAVEVIGNPAVRINMQVMG